MRFLKWLMFWKRKSYQQDVSGASHYLLAEADRRDTELEEYRKSGKSYDLG